LPSDQPPDQHNRGPEKLPDGGWPSCGMTPGRWIQSKFRPAAAATSSMATSPWWPICRLVVRAW